MKFKNTTDETGDYRSLTVKDNDGDAMVVEVDEKRVYIATGDYYGVSLTRTEALKFAQAIITELT